MATVALVILSIVASLLSLRFLGVPYLWISLSWFAVFLHATVSSKNPFLKSLWYSMGILMLVLGGVEAYLWVAQDDRPDKRTVVIEGSDERKVVSDSLGYVSGRDIKVSASRYDDDDLVYSVIYTINSDGLRVSPIVDGDVNPQCVLFFGGSYTFGEGVNDTQTMPYLVGLKSERNYSIYNFAVAGYGPHQMLSALEHGIVEDALDCLPKYAIYQSIPGHVRRTAGLVGWDPHGPRYELGEAEGVSFQGNFDDRADDGGILQIVDRTINQLNKSFLYTTTLGKNRSIHSADVKLTVNIVKAAKDFIETRFAGSEFHVLFWDSLEDDRAEEMITGLKERAIRIHLMSDILPGYFASDFGSTYRITNDGHPNPLAHKMIADYVVHSILGLVSDGGQHR